MRAQDRARPPRSRSSLGDPNGIGPEIAVKLLARAGERARSADIVVFADPAMLAAGERVAAARRARTASATASSGATFARWTLVDAARHHAGRGDARRAAARRCPRSMPPRRRPRRGDVDGIVFAPLNKHAMRLAGLHAGGRAALPAGALRRRRASSPSSTSPARCGPRASRRTCRCATSPTRSPADGVVEAVRIVAPLPRRRRSRARRASPSPASIRTRATAARSAARRST